MTSLLSNYKKLCLAGVLIWLYSMPSVQANNTAKNRNDVFDALSQLNVQQTLPGLDVWVNDKVEDPFVNIGDVVSFKMKSAKPAYFTLIHVDGKGSTSILMPMTPSQSSFGNRTDYLEYSKFKQAEPVGRDTVYLLASEQPISSEVLGIGPGSDFTVLGKDLSAIGKVVQRINGQSTANPLSMVRYAYAVESDDTQYKTRGLPTKLKELEEELAAPESDDADAQTLVFNNINFSWNSADLTVPGRVELDVLGSALVGMQEKNGEFPVIELTGHTDSTGPDVYNTNLSADRALSAKQYLVSEHGIPADQVFTVGVGESVPMESNETKAGRAMNRRVELSIVNAQ